MKCLECPNLKIEEDEEGCTKAKCMKTSKRGRTIWWSMTTYKLPEWIKITGEEHCRKYLETHIPNWCPTKGE